MLRRGQCRRGRLSAVVRDLAVALAGDEPLLCACTDAGPCGDCLEPVGS